MVAIPLLGILAAGLGSQALVQGYGKPWAEGKQRDARGKALTGILDDMDPNAGADETARGLAMGGLLDPDAFMRYGFEENRRGADFINDMLLMTEDARLRNQNTASEYDYRADEALLNSSLIDERNANTAARQADAAELTQQRAATAAAQERQQTLLNQTGTIQAEAEALIRPVEQRINSTQRAIQLANEVAAARRTPGILTDTEIRAKEFELSEIDADLFYDFKNKVYGPTEATGRVLAELQEAFPTYSNTSYESWQPLHERYKTRADEYTGEVASIAQEAQRRVDRLTNPNLGVNVQPTPPSGGIPDSAVIRDGG
ncbi:hypothetical protein [Tropicibacter sp. Alg240-R139]|uniref:hypothetical protein n=1 Tax=Tropicibacter sp. Alg240-R139 TaxID=2305991 RepID=UPI0013DF74DA|nr:hypothetical protein [Tropicibacter sp. Alg240-R139]